MTPTNPSNQQTRNQDWSIPNRNDNHQPGNQKYISREHNPSSPRPLNHCRVNTPEPSQTTKDTETWLNRSTRETPGTSRRTVKRPRAPGTLAASIAPVISPTIANAPPRPVEREGSPAMARPTPVQRTTPAASNPAAAAHRNTARATSPRIAKKPPLPDAKAVNHPAGITPPAKGKPTKPAAVSASLPSTQASHCI